MLISDGSLAGAECVRALNNISYATSSLAIRALFNPCTGQAAPASTVGSITCSKFALILHISMWNPGFQINRMIFPGSLVVGSTDLRVSTGVLGYCNGGWGVAERDKYVIKDASRAQDDDSAYFAKEKKCILGRPLRTLHGFSRDRFPLVISNRPSSCSGMLGWRSPRLTTPSLPLTPFFSITTRMKTVPAIPTNLSRGWLLLLSKSTILNSPTSCHTR